MAQPIVIAMEQFFQLAHMAQEARLAVAHGRVVFADAAKAELVELVMNVEVALATVQALCEESAMVN